MANYDHRKIEKKWQKIWEENQTFKAEIDLDKPKYYILDMFPYPSGAGLHVGHVTGYTATDIIARYKRQMGFNVLHPMGWDSFGLPAEQYAIRTGTHPAKTTEENITTYRQQLKEVGFSYDWSREFKTSDPKYYKWTQWIFTKLFEKGLAYEADILVNYCPELRTVLANEEVEDGKSKEGGHPIERRPLRQWVLKITEYAEKLLNDLEDLDWPEYLKRIQRNWIGKSEGAQIFFKSDEHDIPVYTTSPHTIYGVTYMVLSPEHPLVEKLTTPENRASVEAFQKEIASKSDLERTELSKDKRGVFTGAYATAPLSGKKIPIWISDYVLMGYGTGAVMAVPSHDERDYEFSKKFDLPLAPVVNPGEDLGEFCSSFCGHMINSGELDGLDYKSAISKSIELMEKEGSGKKFINYRLRDWLFSRQRYWGEPIPVVHLEDGSMRKLELDELPLTPPDIADYRPAEDGHSPLAKVGEWVEIIDPKTGKKALRETNTMPQWAGSCWYYLRFCDPHNDKLIFNPEAEKYWMPVDMYVGGVEHAVLHLLYARFWHKVLYDLDIVSTKEPFQTMRNQGLVTSMAYKIPGGNYVAPDKVEKQGEKFFFDGQQLEEHHEKMSKSKLNGVTPDEVIEDFGADALRLYEMFMAPFDKEKFWCTDSVTGCKRFLNRFFDMVYSDKVTDDSNEEAFKLAHRLVKDVQEEIEKMFFNVAVAKMMEFLNAFTKLSTYPKGALKMAVQVLYPFAPHIAEEFWEHLGEKETITFHPFPKVEEKYLVDDSTTYVFQVNGKLRSRVEKPKGLSKEEVLEIAKSDPKVEKHLTGTIVKEIFVPDKLVNIVVK
ncbi:MAG: leucine--tRNA ligase [Chlamydiales bacterium]